MTDGMSSVWLKLSKTTKYFAKCLTQPSDATPQEPSDGLYRCGPTAVEAVKQGEVDKPYDGKFVYAEVNADEVFWLHMGPKQPVKLISQSTTSLAFHLFFDKMFD